MVKQLGKTNLGNGLLWASYRQPVSLVILWHPEQNVTRCVIGPLLLPVLVLHLILY